MLNQPDPKIVIDLSEMFEENDIVYQVGLINAFKKVVDLAGGIFLVNSLSPEIKNYFNKHRLDHIFEIMS